MFGGQWSDRSFYLSGSSSRLCTRWYRVGSFLLAFVINNTFCDLEYLQNLGWNCFLWSWSSKMSGAFLFEIMVNVRSCWWNAVWGAAGINCQFSGSLLAAVRDESVKYCELTFTLVNCPQVSGVPPAEWCQSIHPRQRGVQHCALCCCIRAPAVFGTGECSGSFRSLLSGDIHVPMPVLWTSLTVTIWVLWIFRNL